MGCVGARQIEVADGVVYLVEIGFVAVVARHAAQRAHLRLDVGAVVHLALLDAGVELGAVGGRRRCAGFAEGLVGLLAAPEALEHLAEQEAQTGALGARCCLYGLAQWLHGLLVVAAAHEAVGLYVGVEAAQGRSGKLVGLEALEYELGVVQPVHGHIAARLPQLGLGDCLRQPREMAADVEESGCGAEEVAVEELAAAHHHPCVVQEGVVLVALEPRLVGGIAALSRLAAGALLDAAQLYGLLTLLDAAVEVARGLRRLLASLGLDGMHEHEAGVVVLVAFLHLLQRFPIMGVTVVVDIVAGDEGVVIARGGSVLFG